NVILNLYQEGYDNNLRPEFGGPPTTIEVNMQVRSMGPISELDMSYSMDSYFRQTWIDRRLSFTGFQGALALSNEMLQKIWKPDTFVYNGIKAYVHTITKPNRFVRLFADGRVLYSQRLTISATCLMDLKDFPMDKQMCPLQLGSFGYGIEDIKYEWSKENGVNIAADMKLSQFDLISTLTGNSTTKLNDGLHSTLLVHFHLHRHMGDFVIQVYGPCILLVVISWVSFWLNREATSDRISLGITTVLTMTFLGLEARKDLPKVPYPTALDYFVFISFLYIFFTVIQFGIVHHFTKYGSGEIYSDEFDLVENTAFMQELTTLEENNSAHQNKHLENILSVPDTKGNFKQEQPRRKIRKNCDYKRCHLQVNPLNSVSKIDRISRGMFPISYCLMNIFYWKIYLEM
ncbi:gamma-aminobutyric acid receptor alpha-like, partial [Eurytemora carolleeae]|uniref:gamma-aminobutyric acid receptor alpha-like n=1 Tax=Eurytemora carolleeae TaxID=1294199 RepID=UPI000C76857A